MRVKVGSGAAAARQRRAVPEPPAANVSVGRRRLLGLARPSPIAELAPLVVERWLHGNPEDAAADIASAHHTAELILLDGAHASAPLVSSRERRHMSDFTFHSGWATRQLERRTYTGWRAYRYMHVPGRVR